MTLNHARCGCVVTGFNQQPCYQVQSHHVAPRANVFYYNPGLTNNLLVDMVDGNRIEA